MRLSTAADRDDARANEVITAAIFDTADVYARDDGDLGHNEHALARAIAAFPAGPVVVTKGRLTRPGGAWLADATSRPAECSVARRAGVRYVDVADRCPAP